MSKIKDQKIGEIDVEKKCCSKCKQLFPATNKFFYKEKRGYYGLRSECKKCRAGYDKFRRENNEEKIKNKQCEWYLKNKERIIKEKLEYQKKNKEHIKEINKKYTQTKRCKELRKGYYRKYYLNNKHEYLSRNAKRRQLIFNQTDPNGNKEKINNIYKKCKNLNKKAGEVMYHVDHIIPLSKGGLHNENNLQILFWKDNLKKGNKMEKSNE